MRRGVGFVIIFVLGVALGYFVLRNIDFTRTASNDVAQKRALAILDKEAPPMQDVATLLEKAAARIEPAVVNIDIIGERAENTYDIFGTPVERRYTLQGKGSGVIISPDGYVVTNNHVIEGADRISVTTVAGKKYNGRVVGADPNADLAVVKIDGANLPSATLGSSANLKVGQYVIAIGYPLGIGTTVTHGIISATDRRDLVVGDGRVLKQALQTDAPINRGNSGGALANTDGQLIGINTAIASENGGGNIGIGFAIPMDTARTIIKDLIAHGSPRPMQSAGQPYIGIQYQPLDPDTAAQLRRQPGEGVYIASVQPKSPAQAAGLKPGMIAVAIDGKTITTTDDIRNAMAARKVGDTLKLTVIDATGASRDVTIKLGRRPMLMPG